MGYATQLKAVPSTVKIFAVVLVIMLGYPVLLDVESSDFTHGILKFFHRKLKNSMRIALIVKLS